MFKLTLIVALAALGVAAGSFVIAQEPEGQPPTLPPPRSIPGITAPDAFPLGCVGCHVNRPDMNLDVRLSTLLHQWEQGVDPALLARFQAFSPEGMTLKGKHPSAEQALKDIPNACLQCHGRTSKIAPPFVRLLHGMHLLGGEQNHFLTMFQGECTHCHKLDPDRAIWSFASGPEP